MNPQEPTTVSGTPVEPILVATADPRTLEHPHNDRIATGMLIVVTLLWGLSFPLIWDWQHAPIECPGGPVVAGATLIALRLLLALPILLLFRPSLLRAPTAAEHFAGLVVGCVFLVGFSLQVVGMAWTSPALSGFLTSVGCAWVPLLGWIFLRHPVPRLTMLGIGLGVGGAMILAKLDEGISGSIGWGEMLTLVASVFFAVQIILLDRYGKRVRPGHLTTAFFGVTGVGALAVTLAVTAASGAGIGAWMDWLGAMLRKTNIVTDLTVMTLLSTVLAFHWMNMYQPQVSASRASLIYLLEPVFAGTFSVLMHIDDLTWRLLVGGAIILGGNLLVELPSWLREKEAITS